MLALQISGRRHEARSVFFAGMEYWGQWAAWRMGVHAVQLKGIGQFEGRIKQIPDGSRMEPGSILAPETGELSITRGLCCRQLLAS
jgi:hypothetical protein